MEEHRYSEFLGPRFWSTWLGIGIGRGLVFLPFRFQLWLGRGLGRLTYRLAKKYRHTATRNIETCFPDLSPAEQKELVRRHFKCVGMAFMEMGYGWWASPRRIRKRMEVVGLENLIEAHERGKGVVLLTGHFTCMELTSIMLALCGLPIHGYYRRNKRNLLADEVIKRGRGRYAESLIRREDLRGLIRALRANAIVWFASDQMVRESKRSVMVPFFGEPALTHTGLIDITRMSGAVVVPFLPIRTRTSGRYRLQFLPALDNFPGDDPKKDMLRVNRLIEAKILEDPAQYFWIRPRFGKRPAEYEDIYRASKALSDA